MKNKTLLGLSFLILTISSCSNKNEDILTVFLKSINRADILSQEKSLDKVKTISLEGVEQLDDSHLKLLSYFPNLESLSLFNTPINGGGIQHLTDLEHLKYLYLGKTKFDDYSIDYISKMKKLEGLYIEKTLITDIGVEKLSKNKNLKYLNLSYNGITDASLFYLASLSNLLELDISHTKITFSGYTHIRKLLPNTRIRYWKNDKDLYELEKFSKEGKKKKKKKENNHNVDKHYYYFQSDEKESKNNVDFMTEEFYYQ